MWPAIALSFLVLALAGDDDEPASVPPDAELEPASEPRESAAGVRLVDVEVIPYQPEPEEQNATDPQNGDDRADRDHCDRGDGDREPSGAAPRSSERLAPAENEEMTNDD